MYRVGFLGWKIAARCGVPLLVKIEVQHDEAAGVFIATSPDLRGLVVESASKNELIDDVYDCVNMLLETELNCDSKITANAIMKQAGINHRF